MIKSFRLQNFQSHKDSFLEFHPNLNAIVGASDNGKSAIMRALFAVINNRPTGMAMISDWIKTPKGALKKGEGMYLTLVNDGHTIERFRNENNGYFVDGEKLEAIRADVPEKVIKALNVSDVNIQKQGDRPFLLEESGGDIAGYINSMVNLEEIDQYASAMDSRVRKINDKIKTNAADLEKLNAERAELAWVDILAPIVERLSVVEEEIGGAEKSCQETAASLAAHSQVRDTLSGLSEAIARLEEIVSKVKVLEKRISLTAAQHTGISEQLKKYKEATKGLVDPDVLVKVTEHLDRAKVLEAELRTIGDLKALGQSLVEYRAAKDSIVSNLEKVEDVLARARSMEKRLTSNFEQQKAIKADLNSYNGAKEVVEKCKTQIITLTAKIAELQPSVCPTCGQPLAKGKKCE